MIDLKQHDLVRMLIDRVKKEGKSTTGSYNAADPTYSESGSASFYLGEEPTGEIDKECGYEVFAPVTLEITFDDCTWGVDFKISLSHCIIVDGVGKAVIKETGSGYFDRDTRSVMAGGWTNVEGELFKHLRNALLV